MAKVPYEGEGSSWTPLENSYFLIAHSIFIKIGLLPSWQTNPSSGNNSGFAHETSMKSMIKMIATGDDEEEVADDRRRPFLSLCDSHHQRMWARGISRLPLLNNSIRTGVRKFPLISKISIR